MLLFCLYFGLFYGCSYFVIGITSPTHLYSSIIHERLDFISSFRSLLLHGASALLDILGITNQIIDHSISVPDKIRVTVHTACLGIGILSFWWAIVLAYPHSLKLKFKFLLSGSVFLVGLNILRIFFLAYIYAVGIGTRYSHIDHHLVFNVIVYLILAAMVIKWLNASPVKPAPKDESVPVPVIQK
ncbi:exosortase/archaeosortase family protein [Polluticoccus soli]|uniref:exosortase/archaeosortase family protein n=1 Tax=Polluticoccus soli TaxID=3034150 RepID=UPI0023E15D11|nr:exosortase/archaeosortase family protein [Flavipsychrobacter sp. JY13-12]